MFLDFAATCGEPRYADADSTGGATHTDLPSAIRSALLECLERDALALWWHGHRPARALSVAAIDTLHPRLGWWLSARQRRFVLLDITTDTGVPVVVAASSDPDGTCIAIGSAAGPGRDRAALSAVTEMVQTETAIAQATDAGDPEAAIWPPTRATPRRRSGHRRGRPRGGDLATDAGDPAAAIWTALAIRTLPQFTALGPAAAPGAPMDLTAVLTRLASLDRALAVDLTLPGDPLATARVIVPGLCDGRPHRHAALCRTGTGAARTIPRTLLRMPDDHRRRP